MKPEADERLKKEVWNETGYSYFDFPWRMILKCGIVPFIWCSV